MATMRMFVNGWPALAGLLLVGCGTLGSSPSPRVSAETARARIAERLPATLPDREGWADDLLAVFEALELQPNAENICAVRAVAEQESSLQVDPTVPGLPKIALKEIEDRAARALVPKVLVHAALDFTSPTGETYRARIAKARSERALSEIYEDFIGQVPLGRRLLADYNPVRTGGPMQVSIAFAEGFAREHRYPFASSPNVRREVFSRRGGLYFGTAHLLDYRAHYDQMVHRFADFNAGHYASRNAAFQNAVLIASGQRIALDGDLLIEGGRMDGAGETERATRALGARLRLDADQIRRDLQRGDHLDFEETATWHRVFELAEERGKRSLPRAVVPQIQLNSPKITRQLTTDWFARRVDERYRRCLQ